MVEDFQVDGDKISFSIVLNSQDASMKNALFMTCQETLQHEYPEAQIHLHLKMTSDQAGTGDSVLPQVKNIIAVASGKGGVGKSTVSVNLAVALAKKGLKVGLIDADLYGPSIPTMMGLVGNRPKIELLYGKHKIVPLEAYGVHVISVGFIVDPEQAVVLRGPRLGGLLRQFIQDCLWPELDYLIIDLPPGTGDVQLTLVQTIPVTGAFIVTTPQEVAVVDAVKAMNMFLLPNVQVPILGVIENMSWFTPEELPGHKYYLFGKGGGQRLAEMSESRLLGQLPLVQSVQQSGDEGVPAAVHADSIMGQVFAQLATEVEQAVEYRNEHFQPTRIVKVES
jgi:ATP-binding protein involved in chromosome partitioning